MARLSFEDIKFSENKEDIVCRLYRFFEFRIPKKEFPSKAHPRSEDKALVLDLEEKRAERKALQLISKHIQQLVSSLNSKPAAYIHRNSGVPLIGCIYFGLVDRGTNVIEVKPFTGCNLNCVYCSVDEGRNTRWVENYVVEWEYLVEWFEELAKIKESNNLEAHIAGHSEPTLYPRLAELCNGLSKIEKVKTIAIDTNGTLLTKEEVDRLSKHGLNRVNLSLNAITPNKASLIAGTPYPVEKVLEIAKYINTNMKLVLAPTWIPGINDDEIPKIIEFALELKRKTGRMPVIGIQNFLNYKYGRNPVKQRSFDEFYKDLKRLEKKYRVNLTDFSKMGFAFENDRELPKPMKKDERVDARYLMPGRRKGEHLFSARNRIISVYMNRVPRSIEKVRILRTKNNIFIGKAAE